MKKIKNRLSKKVVLFLASLLAFLQIIPLVPTAAAEQKTGITLKVAYPIVEGMTEISALGKRTGLVVDYLNEISNYTGWNYEYIDVEDTSKMAEEFVQGKYDLIGGVYYNESMTDVYAYPKYNIGYAESVLLARWEDDTIKSYDVGTLNGKKIGILENAADDIFRLEQYIATNSLSCDIIRYSASDLSPEGDLYSCLERGEVDMLVGDSSEAGKKFRAVASYRAAPFYIVSRSQAADISEQLTEALERIYESNPGFAEKTYNAHFPDIMSSNVRLNSEELAYIASGITVKVAVPYGIHPLFCQSDAEPWHNGILYDIFEIIGERTGLRYEFVEADNFGHSVTIVKEGKADVVGIFLDSAESAAERGLALTNSYTNVYMTMVKNKKTTYPSDNLKVAVVEGRVLPSEIDAEIVRFSNITDALKATDSGEVDLAYGISALMEKVIQEKYFSNLVPVSIQDNTAAVRFAVDKPANTPLFTLLNKAIGMIGEDELAVILNRNLESIGVNNYSLSDFIRANPFLFMGIVSAILILVIAIIILIFRFRMRAVEMKLQLEKSASDSRAKSQFLSRMSHEIRTPMNAVIGLTDLVSMQENVPPPLQENLSKIRSSSRYLLALLNDILDMSSLENGMMTIDNEPFYLSKTLDELRSMMSSEAKRRGVLLTVRNSVTHDRFEGDSVRLKQVLTNLVSNAIKFTPADGSVLVSVAPAEDGKKILFEVEDTGIGVTQEDCERIFKAFEQAGNNYSRSRGTGLGLSISKMLVELMGGELMLKSQYGKGSTFYFSIPLKETDAEETSDCGDSHRSLKGISVLIAEDNDLNAEIAQDILEMADAEVVRVADGQEAVDEFLRHGEMYDVILMDILMPNMDGLAATETIRKSGSELASAIPIIAMSANSFQEDIDAAIAAGMNYFVAKPFDIDFLYSVIKQATVNKQRNTSSD